MRAGLVGADGRTPLRMPTTCGDDPLDDDSANDATVVTTRRGLTRLAFVAAEVGARFQREGVGPDPMAWLLAPQPLFGGAPAIEACLTREGFERALMVHGLSLDLDIGSDRIGALLGGASGEIGDGFWDGGDGVGGGPDRHILRRQRLYSAIIVIARGGELVHLFHASVAPAASVVRERIRARFGAVAAAQAEVRLGVDLECPATSEMLPPAFRAMVERGRRIRWSTMAGLDVTVEHRIPS